MSDDDLVRYESVEEAVDAARHPKDEPVTDRP